MNAPSNPPVARTELGWRRRALFTTVYVALLLGVFLVGLELISRRLFQPESRAVFYTSEIVFDAQLGWRGRRNLAATVPHGQYPLPIQLAINSDGFRDASWDEKLRRASDEHRKKILILGDSLLYGWANPVDGRLSEQLQARYERTGPPAEVFNAGIPGYGPNHQLRALPELLERLHPNEVVLVFCVNDYGDAALPYDYRYPFRVYQPFYDPHGQLLFNATVPRRPSLVMRDTWLGRLRLWYAVDQIRYAVEDRKYARYGVPNARTAPVHLFSDFFTTPELRARFPYVEETVLGLYVRMAQLCRAAGTRFSLIPSVSLVAPRWERLDDLLGAKLQSRGVRYVSCPSDDIAYARWLPTLQDGHPNMIWGWILANALHADLEAQPYRLDFAHMPQTPHIPTQMDLSNEPATARYLNMEWGPVETGGRRLRGMASFFLRIPAPGRMRLEITGSAARPTGFVLHQSAKRELCRIELGSTPATQACILDATDQSLLFVHFLPNSSLTDGELPLIKSVRVAAE
jgi:hypothetical protein